MRAVLKKGFMYKFSSRPSVLFYCVENKVLAGKEDKGHSGEALGRKVAVTFFEPAAGGLVKRVSQELLGMHQVLITLAELSQTLGLLSLPEDPERTSATTELLLEAHLQNQELLRMPCFVEPTAPDVHMYSLGPETLAESELVFEVPADQRTKMMLARLLQRTGNLRRQETLQTNWNLPLNKLQERIRHLLFPDPAAP